MLLSFLCRHFWCHLCGEISNQLFHINILNEVPSTSWKKLWSWRRKTCHHVTHHTVLHAWHSPSPWYSAPVRRSVSALHSPSAQFLAEFVEYIFAFLTFSSAPAQHSVSEPHSPSGQFSAKFVEHFLAQNITKQGCGCHGLDEHAGG